MKKIISVVPKGICKDCKKPKALINGLCDGCTIKRYGKLMPWFNTLKELK